MPVSPADHRDQDRWFGILEAHDRFQPFLDRAVQASRKPLASDADTQHDQRDGHHRRGLVRMHIVGPALLAVERHGEQPRHVERGDPAPIMAARPRPQLWSNAASMILSFAE